MQLRGSDTKNPDRARQTSAPSADWSSTSDSLDFCLGATSSVLGPWESSTQSCTQQILNLVDYSYIVARPCTAYHVSETCTCWTAFRARSIPCQPRLAWFESSRLAMLDDSDSSSVSWVASCCSDVMRHLCHLRLETVINSRAAHNGNFEWECYASSSAAPA